MIKQIQELNFPKIKGEQYATLGQATVTLQDMAEKTITSQVKIDGRITPDFSFDWEVVFQGEKYIMPLRQPQGVKENTSLNSTIDLTFHHWAIYQLKSKYFFTLPESDTGLAVPDKYIASVSLNLKDFCVLFGMVLNYYYGDKIILDFNDPEKNPETGWQYANEPTVVEISHSYLWDILIKFYDLYAVRWTIEPNGDIDHYVIKVGYGTAEITHVFEYGLDGGLLKVERQVQDDNIRNLIIGRGGSKNLPYRYFKKHDNNNASFSPDPDWIPELAMMPFSELHGATFRSYIQGWKTKHYGDASVTSAENAYAPWAWVRGYTDTAFNPAEFVADEFTTDSNGYGIKPDSSIAKYGELQGGLDNNEDIFPTIQGVEIGGLGRIDQCVSVQEIESDDVEAAVDNESVMRTLEECKSETLRLNNNDYGEFTIYGGVFSVEDGKSANLIIESLSAQGVDLYGEIFRGFLNVGKGEANFEEGLLIDNVVVAVEHVGTGKKITASGIPPGEYRYTITARVQNTSGKLLNVTVGCSTPKLLIAAQDKKWGNTWDIWVKNLWESAKLQTETDAQYVERVWIPILGDKDKNEAKIVFSTGMLATSSDYEFTIVKDGIHYDTSKTLYEYTDGTHSTDSTLGVIHGDIVASYNSEWRITLAKSDVDLESTGVYIPSTKRFGQAGDYFYFTGIELPYQYVKWAEIRLDDYKKDELAKVKDIRPTFVVSLDKVRIHNSGEANAFVEQLRPGNYIRLADKRFIPGDYVMMVLQSVEYNFTEPSDKEANLLPNVEVILSDTYISSGNPVAHLSGEVSALQKQVGAMSNIERIVRMVGDKLYLRKDGFPSRSFSPTEFASLLTSTGYRAGMVGGKGWGFYKDENDSWVLETDRINVRQEMQVNSLVINQAEGRGGMVIESAAQMNVSRVEVTAEGYVCYFDQKDGTVANLFEIGDVAYNHCWTPENSELKFYKRRVVAIGVNSITLTRGYEADNLPEGWTDGGVSGKGTPAKGDAIIHYGSYTNPNRRFVKVRDVIEGGYERYIEGLDSVNAEGTEYYFVGRKSGMYNGAPRWFVGDNDSNIEYINRQFNLNNVKLSVNSYLGDKTVSEIIGGTDLGYIREALKQDTTISGGLILTSLIKLGINNSEQSKQTPFSGISGLFDSSKKGNGIAAWFGGDMIDKEESPGSLNPAASLFRMDGTGYLAKGNIKWSADGSADFAAGKLKIDHKGNLILGEGVTIGGDQTFAGVINFIAGISNLLAPIDVNENELSWTDPDISTKAKSIKAKRTLISVGDVVAGSAEDARGQGGAVFDRLDNWSDYNSSKVGYVLSAKLGYELYSSKADKKELAGYYSKTESDSRFQPRGAYLTTSGTAANANKFGGLSLSNFVYGNYATGTTDYGDNLSFADTIRKSGFYRDNAGYATLLIHAHHSVDPGYAFQLGTRYDDAPLYMRHLINNVWTGWSQIAFTTSTVAAAQRLSTARRFWGQSFDGTGDVNGEIINAGGAICLNHDDEINRYGGNLYLQNRGSGDGNLGSTANIIALANGGFFGIGTYIPEWKLDVNGDICSRGMLYAKQGIQTNRLQIGDCVIEYDSVNMGLHITRGIYSDGYITAGTE